MKEKIVWQQGAGDGLCGLYALANFFRYAEAFSSEADQADEILFWILEQVETLGWLTPHYIKRGYGPYNLRVIAEQMIASHLLPFYVVSLQTSTPPNGVDPFNFIKSEIESGSSAIVDWGDEGHWVLAREVVNNRIVLWDSDNSLEPERSLSARNKITDDWPNGIIIKVNQGK